MYVCGKRTEVNQVTDQLLKENHMKSKMILQVHDELIFDVYQDELDKMMKLVKEGMESAYQMKVELKAEGTYAKNWYEKKCQNYQKLKRFDEH